MASPQPDYGAIDLAILQGKNPGMVLWQPRLEFWYKVNHKRGTLPPPLQKASLLDVYDYCHASVRYFGNGLRFRYHTVQRQETWIDAKHKRVDWTTPLGTIHEVYHGDEWNLSAYHSEHRLKTPADFRILEYILADEEPYWDQAYYEEQCAQFRGYGAPQYYFRRSPLQNLFIMEMGFERTIYMMNDHPEVIERYLQTAELADDRMYDVICQSPVNILNLGENIDVHMDSPRLWRKYLIPYYRKRIEQMHAAGKVVNIHIDGAMRPLVPYVQDAPFDGIEAATPLPQGDVTLEEIKQALGSMVLLDGIPAIYFLPTFTEDELFECTHKIVKMFYPHLVLGISDEIPPDGDIERVRKVGELAERGPKYFMTA